MIAAGPDRPGANLLGEALQTVNLIILTISLTDPAQPPRESPESFAANVVQENGLAAVTAIHDTIDRTRILESKLSAHAKEDMCTASSGKRNPGRVENRRLP